MMKVLVTIALLLSAPAKAFDGLPAQEVQYGGPPMWDRNWRNPEYQRPQGNPFPPPRRWGPQVGPCIYYGDCQGPRPEYRVPRFPGPVDRYDLYGED